MMIRRAVDIAVSSVTLLVTSPVLAVAMLDWVVLPMVGVLIGLYFAPGVLLALPGGP